MAIKFCIDEEITQKVQEIAATLGMEHVATDRVVCMRSHGSGSRRTIARCYGLTKIWQKALGIKAHYIIEVISEKYDRQSNEDRDKTLIHELMHIPFNFGGGFKHHSNYVTQRNVDAMYKKYVMMQRLKESGLL